MTLPNANPSSAIARALLWIGAALLIPLNTSAQPLNASNTDAFAEPYLDNLYLWFLGFVGVAALFAIVLGGILYMFSGANLTKVDQAKRWIWNAILGIVLAATSYLLLSIINPDLVQHGFDINTIITDACLALSITC